MMDVLLVTLLATLFLATLGLIRLLERMEVSK